MKTLALLFCTCLFYSMSFAQSRDLPPNPEPGKCYAKCLIPTDPAAPRYKEKVKTYPVYTGTTPEQVQLKPVEIILEPATTKWEKKGEGDQKAWCLIEIPAVTETLQVVKNTKQTDDYEMRSVTTRKLIEQNISDNPTEWREVLCNEKITKKRVLKIQETLSLKGYYKDSPSGRFDAITKSALTAYQKDQALPIGNLDIETLRSLNLAFR